MSSSPTTDRIRMAAMKLFAERGATTLPVSDLAQAAGVARGTIYNNLSEPEALFDEVSVNLAEEMYARVTELSVDVTDPARRTALGMRLFIRRTHEEPQWARFLLRFATQNLTLQNMLNSAPAADLEAGIASGRFALSERHLPSAVGLISGTTLAAMETVLAGHLTWREAGSNAAYLALKALGLPDAEAETIATEELPQKQ